MKPECLSTYLWGLNLRPALGSDNFIWSRPQVAQSQKVVETKCRETGHWAVPSPCVSFPQDCSLVNNRLEWSTKCLPWKDRIHCLVHQPTGQGNFLPAWVTRTLCLGWALLEGSREQHFRTEHDPSTSRSSGEMRAKVLCWPPQMCQKWSRGCVMGALSTWALRQSAWVFGWIRDLLAYTSKAIHTL